MILDGITRRAVLVAGLVLFYMPFALAENPLPQAGAVSLVPQTQIRVYFTPGDSAERAIVDQLLTAKESILVQAYSFTNPAIASALSDARSRGVNVVVLLDKSHRTQRYSAADFTANAGITTLIDDRHAIAHNKIMIIDGQVVITGSYNFTRAAEKSNAENLVIIESGSVAEKYHNNWQKHRKHSQPYLAKDRQ
jgi:phosphatidylserine/phosphatidylglycerophosphate/cardiolipin synthase-like enzyme